MLRLGDFSTLMAYSEYSPTTALWEASHLVTGVWMSGMAALDAVYAARIASALCIVSVNVRNMRGYEKS